MTTLSERGQVLLTVPVLREVKAWLRREATRRKLPQGAVVGLAIQALEREEFRLLGGRRKEDEALTMTPNYDNEGGTGTLDPSDR